MANNKFLVEDLSSVNDLSGLMIIEQNGVSKKCNIDRLQEKLIGQEGEVVYLKPDSIKKQTILRSDILICENNDDEKKCTNAQISFKDVFESWNKGGFQTRFGTSGNVRNYFYGIDADYPLLTGTTNVSIDVGGVTKWYTVPVSEAPLNGMLNYNAAYHSKAATEHSLAPASCFRAHQETLFLYSSSCLTSVPPTSGSLLSSSPLALECPDVRIQTRARVLLSHAGTH